MRAKRRGGIVQWLGRYCAGRRLCAGSRRRADLLRRIGEASGAAAGHRLAPGIWRGHGEVAYRCFKWDPAQLPAPARALCRQLEELEERLSRLARRLGGDPRPAIARPGAPTAAPALGAGTAA